jgi:hypothetical protein
LNQAAKAIAAAFVLAAAWAGAQDGPRAYRDINFGDSHDTVARKILKDGAYIDAYGNPFTRRVATPGALSEALSTASIIIDDVPYSITLDFHQDQLYRITFHSPDLHAGYFDTLVHEHRDTLAEVITRARGEPDVVRETSFLDMDDGYVVWSHRWHPNEEGVEYKIGVGEYRAEYYATLWIEWAPLRDAVEAASDDRRDSEINDAANDF